MLQIGITDAFERDYMQRFRALAGKFGEFVFYERDRGARDIGLHLTHKLASDKERMSTAFCWFQMKGVMAETLTDKQFEKAKKKGAVSLDDEDDDYNHPETDEEFPVFMNQDRTQSALERVEQLGGESPEQAAENAQRIVEDMKAISQYPHGDAPEDKSPDDILDMLRELDEKIDELEREDDE